MARSRKLKNIRVEEVSLVDKPANQRPFMFVKSDSTLTDDDPTPTDIEKKFKDMDLSIKSDGTVNGTTIKLNGREIADVRGFMLSLMPVGEEMSIYSEYTVERKGQTTDGFQATATYRLSKADDDPEAIAKKVDNGDITNIEAYLEDLPTSVRQSVQNLIGAVQKEAPTKTEEQTMPEIQDGKTQEQQTKETPKPEAPVVDTKAIASAVVAQLTEAGVSADGIKNAVLEQIAADRKAANDAAAEEAKAHADAVAAGDEVEFASEEEMLAALAAEANQEALDEAASSAA